MDEIDVLILNELEVNGRESFKELASKLNVSDVTVKKRVDKLVSNEIIKRFTIDVDYEKIGTPLVVTIGLSVDPNLMDDVFKKVRNIDEFYTIWKTSGAHTVNIRAAFKDHKHLNKVIDEALSIQGVREYHLSIMDKIIKNKLYISGD